MAGDGGITVSVKTKISADVSELEKNIKSVLSGMDFTKAFFKGDFDSVNSHLKRKAYMDEMEASNDPKKAKSAMDAAGFSDKEMGMMGALKDLSDVMRGFGNSMVGFVQGMFGVVEDIYKQMRKSSPLLEMIENLFNLAMQLFFMPLGNKLAEVMLPAIINMLDAVMDIWDKFEGKTLGEMLSIAIVEGVQLIAGYFTNLGSLLKEQGGIAETIGNLLSALGDFLSNNGVKILELVEKVFSFLMDHLGTFIGLAIEFFVASIAAQAGILAYLMASLDWRDSLGKVMAGAAVTAAVGAGAIGMGTVIGNTILGFAEGGYVPATPGGEIIRIAEGGEGEYIVPESKVGNFVTEMIPYTSTNQRYDMSNTKTSNSNVVNNFYFEGLTNDELKTIIRDEVNDMVSQSKYRGGY